MTRQEMVLTRHLQGVRAFRSICTANVSLRPTSPAYSRPRSTLSKIWMPGGAKSAANEEDGHGKLVRAGFLQQTQSGIFQILPLGLRVQNKLEALVDKHMEAIGASRLALSTITTEELWKRSGRLESVSGELFRLKDRKETPLMLSPTHEEEITTLVAGSLSSYKDLPIRLYQTTRKYRDERRPRHGLLRSREFLMKDLYTFDATSEGAVETYGAVAGAYAAIFADLKLPILVAEASSGDMGGNHSHEYHLPHPIGEDLVAECKSCGYAANDEVATTRSLAIDAAPEEVDPKKVQVWRGVTKDHKTLVNVWYMGSSGEGPNLHAARRAVADLDTSIAEPVKLWEKILFGSKNKASLLNIVDGQLASSFGQLSASLDVLPLPSMEGISQETQSTDSDGNALGLQQLQDGDACPKCESGKLQTHKALELGHTFILGSRYSEPLNAKVTLPTSHGKSVPTQMGCFGIGISRIIGAVAEHLVDERGLNWPRVIAPFEVAVIPTSGADSDVVNFFDYLTTPGKSDGQSLDAVLDDRANKSFGWKMRDADTIGYPVTVVLGKNWKENGVCEVQCRRLASKTAVPLEQAQETIRALLNQL